MPDENEAQRPDTKRIAAPPARSILTTIRRWLIPAILVSSLTAAGAVALTAPRIEEDLGERVAARLAQAGQDWVSVAIDGRDVVLTGTAPTEVQRLEAREAAVAIWGVGRVEDRTQLIPLASPFEWTATRSGGSVLVGGFVPSEEIRNSVIGLVEAVLPASAIDDQIQLARGAPPDFQLGVEFALRILANLSEGTVVLSGMEVSAEGLALDILHYEGALEIVESGIPPGFAVSGTDIDPPVADPYVWSVTVSEQVTVISGSVPNVAVSRDLNGLASQAFSGTLVNDRTELASGAPASFAVMAERALLLASLLGAGEVTLTGSELAISGRARTPETYQTVLALLAEAQPGGLTITIEDIAPSVAEAYVLEVVRSANGVDLIGFMPTEDARAEVLAEAHLLFGEAGTEDRLQIAEGAPRMDWIGAAKFALNQVAALSGGSARISDHAYSLTGAAATSESYERLREALAGTLPSSLVLTNVLLSAPVESPYRLTASVGPSSLTLTGFAPSPDIRQVFTREAERRFSTLAVANEVRLAQGAPAGFEAAVVAGLQAISRLESGQFELVDLTVSISGVAPYDGAIARIEAQLGEALPDNFEAQNSLTAAPAQSRVSALVCQGLLDSELGGEGIKFNEGSTAVAPESEGRLDRLVAILQRCPDALVEVGGHTDSAGAAARNEALSQIRADSVVNYLTEAGIAADRLTALGYGESNPIASNDTEEGRARNRRIEFTLVEP